jgi:hypothetical protein
LKNILYKLLSHNFSNIGFIFLFNKSRILFSKIILLFLDKEIISDCILKKSLESEIFQKLPAIEIKFLGVYFLFLSIIHILICHHQFEPQNKVFIFLTHSLSNVFFQALTCFSTGTS